MTVVAIINAILLLARAVGVPISRHLGSQLGTTLVATKTLFFGPLAAIFDFAGCAALKAVSECPQRR